MRITNARLVVSISMGCALAACNANVLDLGSEGAAIRAPVNDASAPLDDGSGSTDGSSSDSALPSDSVSLLDDADAEALCQWLAGEWLAGSYPDLDASFTQSPLSWEPGYVSGEETACGVTEIGWPRLTAANCVLNLRHSACPATVAEVRSCATFLAAHMDPNGMTDAQCAACAAACTPFVSIPACQQTVFQGGPYAASQSCFSFMPITPGVSCLTDGG